MKGFVSTLAVLLIFLVVFSLASIFSTKSSEFSTIPTRNLILDKVYNKFIAIEYGIQRILEEESGFGGINVTIIENKFNLVKFEEVLPTNTTNFKEDMNRFENFTESKLNETNLIVDLNLTSLKNCLPLTVIPYNATYSHPDRPDCLQGQEELKIDPNPSLNFLNAYTTVFKLVNASLTSDPSFGGPGCKDGNLLWNVTVIGDNSTFGPVIKNVQPNKMCKLNVTATCNPTAFKASIREGNIPDGTMVVEVQPGCTIISKITLNLTDINGKVRVGFPPQAIKVKETLYQIEKNDTIYIFGD